MKVRHRIFSSAFSLGGSVRSGGSAQLSRVRNKMSAAAAFLCAKVQVVRRFIFSGGERRRERHYVFHSRPFFPLFFLFLIFLSI